MKKFIGVFVLVVISAGLLVGCNAYGTAYSLDYPKGVWVNNDGIVTWKPVTHDKHTDISYEVRWKTKSPTMMYNWQSVTDTQFKPKDELGLPKTDMPAIGQPIDLEVRAVAKDPQIHSRWVNVPWVNK